MAGAYHNATIFSGVCGAAIKRGLLVQFDNAGKLTPCAATSDPVIGVYDPRDNDDAAKGSTIGVVVQGQAQAFAGAAISAGDPIVVSTASGTSGYAAPLDELTSLTSGQGCRIVGFALEAAAKNEAFTMLVAPQFYVKRSN